MDTKNNISSLLRVVSQLGKFRISLPVAFTTFTGYILSHGTLDSGVILPVLGIFLLASGASALNQIQEMKIDQDMNRTQNRPLPSGKVSVQFAWMLVVFFFLAGSLVLLTGPGWLTFLVGFATFIWYNAIYTPLKKVSAFAAVPGSVVGALPPLAGWVAGGGNLWEYKALVIGIFFFIGQIPHFWLLLLKFGAQYEKAGLPSLTKVLSVNQLRRLTFVWIAAMGVIALAIPVFRITFRQWTGITVIILSVSLVVFFTRLLSQKSEFSVGRSFLLINMYYLLIMFLMISDRLF